MYIFEVNIFGIHIAPSYYGLMYILAFLSGFFYIKYKKILQDKQLDDLLFYVFLGVVLGGRIGYILFYDLGYYLTHLTEIFKVWKGGMSFHGGFLGVVLGVYLFCKRYKISFWKIIDELAVIVPIGIFFGRIGNYLNKELLGFSGYNSYFAVYKGGVGYFPSPLIEAILEGFLLCIFLYFINKYKKYDGKTSGFFLIGYSLSRIFIELFFRTPDSQIGYIFGFLTMGIILSLPMFLLGLWIIFIKKS